MARYAFLTAVSVVGLVMAGVAACAGASGSCVMILIVTGMIVLDP